EWFRRKRSMLLQRTARTCDGSEGNCGNLMQLATKVRWHLKGLCTLTQQCSTTGDITNESFRNSSRWFVDRQHRRLRTATGRPGCPADQHSGERPNRDRLV